MGSEGAAAADVPVEVSSDEEDGERMPAAAAGKRKSPEGALDWAERMLAEDDLGAGGEGLAAMQEFLDSLMDASGIAMGDKESAVDDKNNFCREGHGDDDEDDDDCVILDGDPEKPVAVAKEEGPRRDAAEDELQIVAEKGEIACRDFPHPRHLCAALPFSTSSHASHCSMCHCYVCDSPAPCALWGNGTAHTDHCHATDKDAKWKILRQSSKNNNQPALKRRSIQNFHQSSATGPSSQPSANVKGSTGRLPVSSGVGQNWANHFIMVPWNTAQGISMPRTPSPMPRATIPSYGPQSAQVAPAVYKPSNINLLQASVPSYGSMQPAQSRAFQLAQIPPGGRSSAGILQSNHPQLRPGAPIGSQGHQYRPPSCPQRSPNMGVGTGVPLSRCTSVATQGTQYPQVPSADTGLKEALANLAHELGVPDYNTNQPLGQQSESTPQSLHPSRVLAPDAQAKASQRVKVKKSYVAGTSQMRPSNGHNSSNHASAGTVLSSGPIQMRQPLCQMNSQSSVIPSETAPSTLLDGK